MERGGVWVKYWWTRGKGETIIKNDIAFLESGKHKEGKGRECLPAGFGAAPESGRFRTDCVGWEGLGSPHRKKGNEVWKSTAKW